MVNPCFFQALLVLGKLAVVLNIEAFRSFFTPDMPEWENAESECGERSPLTAEYRRTIVVDSDDDKGTGDNDGVRRLEDDLKNQGLDEAFEEEEPERHAQQSCVDEDGNIAIMCWKSVYVTEGPATAFADGESPAAERTVQPHIDIMFPKNLSSM